MRPTEDQKARLRAELDSLRQERLAEAQTRKES